MKSRYFTSQRLKQILLPLLSCLLAMTACGGLPDKEKQVGIRGFVMEISGDGTSGNISVEGIVESDTFWDKASVTITRNTRFEWKATGKTASMEDLHVGNRIEVVFTGPVAESYPVQGTADIVRILSD